MFNNLIKEWVIKIYQILIVLNMLLCVGEIIENVIKEDVYEIFYCKYYYFLKYVWLSFIEENVEIDQLEKSFFYENKKSDELDESVKMSQL